MKTKIRKMTSILLFVLMLVGTIDTSASALNFSNWTQKADMLINVAAYSSVQVDGKIYVFGGKTSAGIVDTSQVYDISSDSWNYIEELPTVRYFSGAAEVNGKIYVFGGETASGTCVATNEQYDPETNTWNEDVEDMPVALGEIAVSVVNEKIYVFGGRSSSGAVDTAYVYDPETDTWEEITSMPTARLAAKAMSVNGMIYVIGGYNSSTLTTVEMYNPNTDSWDSTTADLNTARCNMGIISYNNNIYVLGGSAGDNSGAGSIEEYNTNSNTWTTVGTMDTVRRWFDACVVDNTVFVYGGANAAASSYLSTVEVSVTPTAEGNALLRITMITGENKEYDLTADEVSSFVSWYNNEESNRYNFTLDYNVGTLATRTEHVAYDKIAFFEVMAYEDDSSSITTTTETYTSLLKVTMVTGDTLEYERTDDELDAFNNWYDGGATDSPTYLIDKVFNLGPFTSRTVYIVYDMISDYETMEY